MSDSAVANGPPAGGRARLLLASGSATRARLLAEVGLDFEVVPSGVDEHAVKDELRRRAVLPGDVALALAEAKASRVSAARPAALVLGADQILCCDGRLFDKPVDLADARDCLRRLSGRRHELYAAAVLVCDGAVVWRHVQTAGLSMRALSDGFIDWYIDAVGETVLQSVGAYRVEAMGALLFSRVDGDLYTVLGLPLLPLLDELRRQGLSPT